jgi:hypothetical protein
MRGVKEGLKASFQQGIKKKERALPSLKYG